MNKADPIMKCFGKITDTRGENKRHKLIDIIVISICATICGAEGWNDIELFGNIRKNWFENFLELPCGIPSHDTIARVFAAMNPEEFRKAFLKWVKTISKITKGQVIAIDGKTLRRSYDKSNAKAAIHMVSAWATSNSIVLGQIKTAEKSNEITAIPELLRLLDIKGCIISIDAMGTQRKIAKTIIVQGGDYILSLKENQKNLCKDVALFFEDNKTPDSKNIKFHEEVDSGHGRIEIRRCWVTSDINWLCGKENWAKIKTICMIERERHIGDSVTKETAYYIASISDDAELFNKAVRSHWGVENCLHWVLDMTFREDESRIRKGNSPDNFAIVRHIALNFIKSEKSTKLSVKAKRKKSAWDNAYLEKILSAAISE